MFRTGPPELGFFRDNRFKTNLSESPGCKNGLLFFGFLFLVIKSISILQK